MGAETFAVPRSTEPEAAACLKEVVIAVMGVTGVGKSSFVRLVTGNDSVKVGHSLHACTSEVESYSFEYRSTKFVVVDTPGFDDTNLSDTDILRKVHTWLENSYRNGTRLTAILYLHRITDPRVGGSALSNLHMFKKLCGPDAYSHVMLGTTFWEALSDQSVGHRRLQELTEDEDLWGGMISHGSEIARVTNVDFLARELLYRLSTKGTMTLDAQRESVLNGKSFEETTAARALASEAEELAEKYRQEAERVREQEEAKSKERAHRRQVEIDLREREMAERLRKEEERKRKLREEAKKRDEEHKKLLEEQRKERERLAREQEELAERMAQLKITRANEERAKRNLWLSTEAIQTLQLLVDGKASGSVLCHLREINSIYLTACDHCLESLGLEPYWVCTQCTDCIGQPEFTLCDSCHSAAGVYCDDKTHYTSMEKRQYTDNQGGCHRIVSPIKRNGNIFCDRCGDSCGLVYLHCCFCDSDDFDMCVKCAFQARTCKKPWSLGGHPLDIRLRYPA